MNIVRNDNVGKHRRNKKTNLIFSIKRHKNKPTNKGKGKYNACSVIDIN